ncbi:hypothetical protein [Streptomyces sp. SID13031]|uniref:hypothetical protein n=1 Tax=Streptomyces sp. SID13031 TaxID=2706046 RepID=UPI0013C6381D|nr:hypothetical protein [Streptomyces sp. SID13031]NEA33154.1 hypothetical protein [Streptomyces sp. SID13031]
MPVPYVQECRESMAAVSGKVEAIRKAIKELQGFANVDTWSGTQADKWMADLNHRVKAVEACLDVKVPAAKAECLKNAQRMQSASSAGAVKAQ